MSKQVRCVSPHGGAHHGLYHNGEPVRPVPEFGTGEDGQRVLTGSHVPEIPAEKLRLPANEGGWIADGRIPGGHAAVGQVYEVADDFQADGFHWEDVTGSPPPPPADAGLPGEGA